MLHVLSSFGNIDPVISILVGKRRSLIIYVEIMF